MTRRRVPERLRASIPPPLRALASPAVEYVAAPLARRLPLRRFVIVSGMRTGSELLRSLLDSLDDVRCQGELLIEAKRWPVAYLNGRAAIGGLDSRAWGCKIIDTHLQRLLPGSRPGGDRVLAELAAPGWSIVHLQRRDQLAQALSILHAMQGQWHFHGPARFDRFEADPATVIALLHMLDCNARWLEAWLAGVPRTDVSYEDDLQGAERQAATVARLAALLGVPATVASTSLQAVAPAEPAGRLTNFPEVALALQHTRFAALVKG